MLPPCLERGLPRLAQPRCNLCRKGGGKSPHSKKRRARNEALTQRPSEPDRRLAERKIPHHSMIFQDFALPPASIGTFKTMAVMSSCHRPSAEKNCTSSNRKSSDSSADLHLHWFQISPSLPQLKSSRCWFRISCRPSVAKAPRLPEKSAHDEFPRICRQTCRKGSHLSDWQPAVETSSGSGTPAFEKVSSRETGSNSA